MTIGPLKNIKVVEFCGLGPVTFGGMMLADLGADVVRIIRPGHIEIESGATLRGRKNVVADLRSSNDREKIRDLIARADVLIEGYRPGVMEKFGLGPEDVHALNGKLIYGRMTGWGQTGSLKHKAGHDINYISITGALRAIGTEKPEVPLNLIGDYGGGALYLVVGVLAALLNIQRGGEGQTIDCAICDGTASLMSLIYGLMQDGRWKDTPASNKLDGSYPRYRTYQCKDGNYISVGALEEKFYRELVRTLQSLGFDLGGIDAETDWSTAVRVFERIFLQKTRNEWLNILADSDACVAPVNSIGESLQDSHLRSRNTFIELGDEMQPAPAPRFSGTPTKATGSKFVDFEEIMSNWEASNESMA